jgi:hypothetical protein
MLVIHNVKHSVTDALKLLYRIENCQELRTELNCNNVFRQHFELCAFQLSQFF